MKKVTKIEEAILALAEYMEDINHADYKIKQHIAEILELELINPPTQL